MTERETSQVEIKENENISTDTQVDASAKIEDVEIKENENKVEISSTAVATADENNISNHTTVHKKIKKPLITMPTRKKEVVTDDAKESKKYAWLAYILFFIPLLINKKNNFVRLHANEGFELNLVDLLGLTLVLIGALINTASLVWNIVLVTMIIIGASLLILTTVSKIYMIIASLKGLRHQTPWFCKYRFIKDVE